MKSILSTLIILLYTPCLLFAQSFAPVNANWHYSAFRIDCNPYDYIKVVVEKDTTILNQYVTVLEVYKNGVYIPEGRLFIHEANDQVFFFEDNEFKLLYDFTLEAGDTALVNIPRNRIHYDYSCSNDLNGLLINYKSRIVVDSTSYISVDGVDLKRLHTSSIDDYMNDCFEFWTITERIGSQNGLCGWNCVQCLAGCFGFVRCYSDNEISFNPMSVTCVPLSSPVNTVSQQKLSFYPNPTANELRLSGSIPSGSYRIFSMEGKILLEGALEKDWIALTSLSPGAYIMGIYNIDQVLLQTERILKH